MVNIENAGDIRVDLAVNPWTKSHGPWRRECFGPLPQIDSPETQRNGFHD